MIPTPHFSQADRKALVAEAALSPSVHNVQPTRFRFTEDGAIELFEDLSRRITIGDPSGADALKSVGAAAEGVVLALSARKWSAEVIRLHDEGAPLRAVARITVGERAETDPLHRFVAQRESWRGPFDFDPAGAAVAAKRVAHIDDLLVIADRKQIASIAATFDQTSLEVLRRDDYRAELLSWMRLSKRHSNWGRDGLNAEALALDGFSALGAGFALGGFGFRLLDRMGMAGPLISERKTIETSAAIGLFHRPQTEDPFETGRRFHRLWLEITAAGLHLCPMSVLADVPETARQLLETYRAPPGRALVSVFRIGVRPNARRIARARLPVPELMI